MPPVSHASETHHDRRRRLVHERILAAAVECFEARGLDATRVDDICDAAEVAQKTFFNHFPNKQALIHEMAAMFLGRVADAIDEVCRKPGPTDRRILELFERISTEAEVAPPMRRTLVIEMIRSLHDDPDRRALGESLRELFASILREGVRAGEVTEAHSVAVLSQTLSGAFYVLCLDWVGVDDFPFRARARALARFFADAIRPQAATTSGASSGAATRRVGARVGARAGARSGSKRAAKAARPRKAPVRRRATWPQPKETT